MLATRDHWVDALGARLLVASVEEAIATGVVVDDGRTSRNRLQTGTLLDAIETHGYTAVFGGGRRDEEKARAKSGSTPTATTSASGPEEPAARARSYNGRLHPGDMRVFPLSNWTGARHLALPRARARRDPVDLPAHRRRVFERDGMLLSEHPANPRPGEVVTERTVRFRTVGDLTLTGCVESTASTLAEAFDDEVAVARVTERGATRGDDRFSEAAMEDRKREG